jgi:hypothetical protein
VLRRAHENVVRMHRRTVLARGAFPHPAVQARFPSGEVANWYLYRSAAGLLCDDVTITSGDRPISGALTPGLPCVPGAPCGAICLTQVHCCGANVLVGTVTASAEELEAVYDDGSTVRYRLDGPRVPGRPQRQFLALEIAPHGYADPVRLFARGRLIAHGSVKGLG